MDIPFQSILPHRVDFDPNPDLDAFLNSVPARWVVYLLADESGRAVQLLCVKNLRASLKRRLGGEETIGPSRRVNYRDIIRQIHWRRVDSRFEADVVYLEAARELFPQTYQGMVGFRPAWFVHVNPEANFPRYIKTIDLAKSTGVLIGPVEDKHAAAKLMELAEDAFDLCRYYTILVQAPHTTACAYKEMGKCPAPCDGSISMEQYRRLIELSAATLVDPAPYLRDQIARMQAAAADLHFEKASKIKSYIEQLSQLGKGPFRHARKLNEFQYLSLQRGPLEGTAKIFLITPTSVEEIAGLISEPAHPGDVLRLALTIAHERANKPLDQAAIDRIGVVSHHLFLAKQSHGVFIPFDEIDEKSIRSGWRALQKQKPQDDPASDSEGVMKELQAF